MIAQLHPDLIDLEFLLGSWVGRGHGTYPTIEPFDYDEEIVFSHVGKPFLAYRQATRGVDGSPLHSETGYVRPNGATPELVIAQPTGLTEVHAGKVTGTTLRFASQAVGRTETAVAVTQVVREIEVADDVLSYRLSMEAVDQPLQLHLEAVLRRAG